MWFTWFSSEIVLVVLKELVQIIKGCFFTFLVDVITLSWALFGPPHSWVDLSGEFVDPDAALFLSDTESLSLCVVGVTLPTSFWTREKRPICLAECSEKEEKEAPWADPGRADPGGGVLGRVRSQPEVFVELWLRSTATSRAMSLWWWSRQNRDLGLRPTGGTNEFSLAYV